MNRTRHPWRSRSFLLAVITAAATLAVAWGLDAGTVETWVGAATAAISALAAVGIVKSSEAHTTPVDDPRDDAGRRLVPKGQL